MSTDNDNDLASFGGSMLQRLEASAQVQRDVNRVTDGGEDLQKSMSKYRKFIPEVHSTAKGYTPSDVRSCINFGVTTQYELYQHMHSAKFGLMQSMQQATAEQYKTDTACVCMFVCVNAVTEGVSLLGGL